MTHAPAHPAGAHDVRFQRRALLVLALTLVVAGLAGAMTGAVGRFVYLAVAWPTLAGVLVGVALMAMMRRFKVHGGRVGAIFGGLGGLFALLAQLAVAHDLTRADVLGEVSRANAVEGERLDAAVRQAMEAQTGGPSSAAPIALRLHSGVRLFGSVRLDFGVPGNGALLVVEAALAALAAARLGRRQGGRPFDVARDAWLARRRVGTAPHGSVASLQSELETRQFHRLGRRLSGPSGTGPVVLHAWVVDGDAESAAPVVFELEVSEATGAPRIVATHTATGAELEAILESQALRDGKA